MIESPAFNFTDLLWEDKQNWYIFSQEKKEEGSKKNKKKQEEGSNQ